MNSVFWRDYTEPEFMFSTYLTENSFTHKSMVLNYFLLQHITQNIYIEYNCKMLTFNTSNCIFLHNLYVAKKCHSFVNKVMQLKPII